MIRWLLKLWCKLFGHWYTFDLCHLTYWWKKPGELEYKFYRDTVMHHSCKVCGKWHPDQHMIIGQPNLKGDIANVEMRKVD